MSSVEVAENTARDDGDTEAQLSRLDELEFSVQTKQNNLDHCHTMQMDNLR